MVKRRLLGLLGTKSAITVMMDGALPATTSIDAGAIPELKDPGLRFALQLADAADAVGWTSQSPTCMTAHGVEVIATDAGADSQLLAVQFTGTGKGPDDTFMQNLHSAAPPDVNSHQ